MDGVDDQHTIMYFVGHILQATFPYRARRFVVGRAIAELSVALMIRIGYDGTTGYIVTDCACNHHHQTIKDLGLILPRDTLLIGSCLVRGHHLYPLLIHGAA